MPGGSCVVLLCVEDQDYGNRIFVFPQSLTFRYAKNEMQTILNATRFDDTFYKPEIVVFGLERFGKDVRIVLYGVSMGGATVLMALGLPEIQETVSAVIADCAYTSPGEIFAHVIEKDCHIPPAPIIKLTSVYAQLLAGYRYDEYSTVDALQNNRVPVLFIHGKEDNFVPTWMSQKNYDVCASKKRLLFAENAGHGMSAFENLPLYERTEKEFLNDALKEA